MRASVSYCRTERATGAAGWVGAGAVVPVPSTGFRQDNKPPPPPPLPILLVRRARATRPARAIMLRQSGGRLNNAYALCANRMITSCAGGRHNMPRPLQVDLRAFDLESGVRVTCDVG